jgi:hypothetical protein
MPVLLLWAVPAVIVVGAQAISSYAPCTNRQQIEPGRLTTGLSMEERHQRRPFHTETQRPQNCS